MHIHFITEAWVSAANLQEGHKKRLGSAVAYQNHVTWREPQRNTHQVYFDRLIGLRSGHWNYRIHSSNQARNAVDILNRRKIRSAANWESCDELRQVGLPQRRGAWESGSRHHAVISAGMLICARPRPDGLWSDMLRRHATHACPSQVGETIFQGGNLRT